MKPHKHAELIKLWADGAEIEQKPLKQDFRFWSNFDGIWSNGFEYRIKPEPKPDITKIFRLEAHAALGLRFQDHTEPLRENEQYIKIVFNDGKLKSAEVLK